MLRAFLLPAVLVFALLGGFHATGAEDLPKAIVLSSDRGQIAFSPVNGSILSVAEQGKSCGLQSGEQGLWQIRFRDGSVLNAAEFSSTSTERQFRYEAGPSSLRFTYHSADMDVVVTVSASDQGIEFVGRLTPRAKTVLDFALPARMRFLPTSWCDWSVRAKGITR